MTSSLQKFITRVLSIFLLLTTMACSDSKVGSPILEPDGPTPQIIVMYSMGGLGDQSYNDKILQGIQRFKMNHYGEFDMYQYSPLNEEDAFRLLDDWLSLPESDIPALFIVAASDYESILSEMLHRKSPTKNKQILFFEGDFAEDLPVTTFRFSMYGAAYLGGVAAAAMGRESILVMLAYEEKVTGSASEGFQDGFLSVNPNGKIDVTYLADDWTGFIAAQDAYKKMSEWTQTYDFIFPVAGGSNQGIYRYTREYENAPLTAGMDVDQSSLSNNIIGSLIKNIDRVIEEYLTAWLFEGVLPESTVLDLSSDYIGWLPAPLFMDYNYLIEQHRETAIIKEKEYNEK